MIEKRDNSVIFRDVDVDNVLDFTHIGSSEENFRTIELEEESNGFILGDAIYYDIKTNHYRRALAINDIMSEVIGVVSKIINKDRFELTMKGTIILDRYDTYENGDFLYLSDIITGKLVNLEPRNISKIIAVKINNGIKIDIQRGYHLLQTDEQTYTDVRYYTNQEIQDVITTIMTEIY